MNYFPLIISQAFLTLVELVMLILVVAPRAAPINKAKIESTLKIMLNFGNILNMI